MGFPNWTLWGMGLTAVAAMIAIGVAYLLQTPRFVSRFRLDGSGAPARARIATGFAFAFILLAFGFFLAGVPLDPDALPAESDLQPEATILEDDVEANNGEATADTGNVAAPTPSPGTASTRSTTTGAFAGPAPTAQDATGTPTRLPTGEPGALTTATSTPTPSPQNTATPTTQPTSTPTSTPTFTPSPTVTPTPIDLETAVINTQGSTLWVRRTPGGQPLALVRDGDLVILSTGHAHQGGIVWREVSTVSGETGWVQEEFLVYDGTP